MERKHFDHLPNGNINTSTYIILILMCRGFDLTVKMYVYDGSGLLVPVVVSKL